MTPQIPPTVAASIRALAASRPGWLWWAEPDAACPALVEVAWQAPGSPVGAVTVLEDDGPAAVRAAIVRGVHAYEAVYPRREDVA